MNSSVVDFGPAIEGALEVLRADGALDQDDIGPIRCAWEELRHEIRDYAILRWRRSCLVAGIRGIERMVTGIPLICKLRKLYCTDHNIVTVSNYDALFVVCTKCGRTSGCADGLITSAENDQRSWWTRETWRSL
jgi:hypothetical protein